MKMMKWRRKISKPGMQCRLCCLCWDSTVPTNLKQIETVVIPRHRRPPPMDLHQFIRMPIVQKASDMTLPQSHRPFLHWTGVVQWHVSFTKVTAVHITTHQPTMLANLLRVNVACPTVQHSTRAAKETMFIRA